jgi:hypothetical protein
VTPTRKVTVAAAAVLATVALAVAAVAWLWPTSAQDNALHACQAFLDASLGDPYTTPAARGEALVEAVEAARWASRKDPRWDALYSDLELVDSVARRHGYDTSTNVSVLAPAAEPSEIATTCSETGLPP